MIDLHPRVVYRTLRSMEENGWITSDWDDQETQGPPRRVYSLTDLGNEALKSCIQTLRQTRDQISDLIVTYQQHMEKGHSDDYG
jgi:DNA-binding PadR family transcriptional regulator